MARLILNKDAIESIRNNNNLQADIANVLGISLLSVPRLIRENSIKLTSASVMILLRERLNLKDNEILEEEKEPVIS